MCQASFTTHCLVGLGPEKGSLQTQKETERTRSDHLVRTYAMSYANFIRYYIPTIVSTSLARNTAYTPHDNTLRLRIKNVTSRP